ncbi:MAG: hypothetical protein LBO06_05655 [Bacteroidales bacterium]|jgi:uncharacterized protein YceK|nr:hypothetical protein [Bacteroidales bacterium]
MKKRICYILISFVLLSTCGLVTSCSTSNQGDYGMSEYKGKKSQKVRQNYKVKGYGDAGKAKKK